MLNHNSKKNIFFILMIRKKKCEMKRFVNIYIYREREYKLNNLLVYQCINIDYKDIYI